MKKINVEQRSLAWHNMRATRIGASEAWGIVQHYATDAELLAAGIDPLEARSEINKAYTSAYALYQRIKGNPYPQTIDFWDSQFGEAVEYWVRSKYTTAPKAEVYADKFNICSLDLADATDGWWCAPIVDVNADIAPLLGPAQNALRQHIPQSLREEGHNVNSHRCAYPRSAGPASHYSPGLWRE